MLLSVFLNATIVVVPTGRHNWTSCPPFIFLQGVVSEVLLCVKTCGNPAAAHHSVFVLSPPPLINNLQPDAAFLFFYLPALLFACVNSLKPNGSLPSLFPFLWHSLCFVSVGVLPHPPLTVHAPGSSPSLCCPFNGFLYSDNSFLLT